MRKIGLVFIILLSFAQFVSCSNNDDIPEKAQIGDIQTDCDNYGSGQKILLRCDKTLPKGKAIEWTVDGVSIGQTNMEKDSIVWTATIGQHTIDAKVDDVIKTKNINVIKCDLAYGIIGDPIEKIIRTLDVADSYNNKSDRIQQGSITYYFTNKKLTEIVSERNMTVPLHKKEYLLLPLSVFNQYYGPTVERFGEPYYSDFSNLDINNMDESTKANYGLSVLNGIMELNCFFHTQANNVLVLNLFGQGGYSYTIRMAARK